MRQAFIILSAVIALLASAKTNTTRPVAGISEKTLLMKTINAENDTASFADKIILSGYKKTVNDKQIDAVMKKIITNLQKQLGAQLR